MSSTADSSFGGLLRGFRHGAGLTLEALSERSGVTGRAISNMERGHSRSPQRRTLVLLADALELTGTERAALVEAAAGRGNVAGSGRGWCELPRGLSDFTGRTDELAWLAAVDSSRDTDTGSGAVAAVAVVVGQPGLGKTSLAVRFASEADAERFPDGVFFVALRGLDDQPMSAAEALWRLLRAFDVPEYRIPEEVDDRAGLYRAELRDRRCLVVLDNALDETQVRPLIPSDGPSMVVITSRRALSGLAGVDRLEPAGLSGAEATELLRGIATHLQRRPGCERDRRAGEVVRLPAVGVADRGDTVGEPARVDRATPGGPPGRRGAAPADPDRGRPRRRCSVLVVVPAAVTERAGECSGCSAWCRAGTWGPTSVRC